MKPLDEARAEVLAAVHPLPIVAVGLQEARGLALAEDVVATEDVPPFDNSAMDGFAVQRADLDSVPVILPILEDVPAGSVPTQPLISGSVIKIMTGAPLPDGADTVVKVEDTLPAGTTEVQILAAPDLGTAVRRAGGDVKSGTTVFTAGTRLSSTHLSVLASLGVATPRVRRRPIVAYMTTGDELVPASTATLLPGQIRDANTLTVGAILDELGVEGINVGAIGDNADELRAALRSAADQADIIMTTGGVSMGEYDLVKQVLTELGGVEFWKVAMQPGKPFAFGQIAGTPLFGLPGNPVSVMVAFEQFARPALLKMMGSSALLRPRLRARLERAVSTNPDKIVFLRVALSHDGDVLTCDLSGGQDSNVLSALAGANGFAVVPVGTGRVGAGEFVDVEILRLDER